MEAQRKTFCWARIKTALAVSQSEQPFFVKKRTRSTLIAAFPFCHSDIPRKAEHAAIVTGVRIECGQASLNELLLADMGMPP